MNKKELEFTETKMTIYADDIQISINDLSEIENIINIITEEFTKAGFEINPNKTRLRKTKYGYRRILGVNVGYKDMRATRKVMRKIRACRHLVQVVENPKIRREIGQSLGGLVVWSKVCSGEITPKKKKIKFYQ